MNYEVELSIQADADLRGIYEYIAFTLLAPENASSQLDRLESGILSLDQYPMRHRLYEKEPWKSRGLRVLPVDNYVIYPLAFTPALFPMLRICSPTLNSALWNTM